MLKILGDVHAGRVFRNDVPLHRRGEREKMVLEQLRQELEVDLNITSHIQLGDLFDSFDVDNRTILDVASAYNWAAHSHPQCCFYLYPGNHDLSKSDSKASAFQIFAEIVRPIENIKIFWTPDYFKDDGKLYGVLPFSPFKTALEQSQALRNLATQFEAVFTHCDTQDFGGDNVLPTKSLWHVTKKIINGHVHTPSEFLRDGVQVVNFGSMQPYSHAEDKGGNWYVTLTPEELRTRNDLHHKYVRILAKKGEPLPDAPDCLGFKVVYQDEKQEDINIDVEIESFNTRNIFVQCLEEQKVSRETQQLVLEKFDVQET